MKSVWYEKKKVEGVFFHLRVAVHLCVLLLLLLLLVGIRTHHWQRWLRPLPETISG